MCGFCLLAAQHEVDQLLLALWVDTHLSLTLSQNPDPNPHRSARSMRHEVDQLLLALWADPACKTSLVALAKDSASAKAMAADASGGVLIDYARAVLNDLMYLLKVRHVL